MEALKGIRILDMTHVQAGPTCSQLLAWMGADVIKLESPVGDATRGQLRDIPNADSLYFTMLNCNKRSITVNMKSPDGKAAFVELLKKSDVLMEIATSDEALKLIEKGQMIVEDLKTHWYFTGEDQIQRLTSLFVETSQELGYM